MGNLKNNETTAQCGRSWSHNAAGALGGDLKVDDGGFGTLGASPDEPTSFFGSNEGAYIDDEGFLHGLPSCDALNAGSMVFPSLVFEQCIQVHLAQCWPDFVEALEADLETDADEDGSSIEPELRAKALALLASQPERIPFENGAIVIPRVVMDETGVDGGEEIIVIGNDGYFEIFNKAAHDKMMQETDLLGILFGD